MKLLVFPLAAELKAFVSAMSELGESSEAMLVEKILVHSFESLDLICAVGGHGKVQFAVQTQFLLNYFTKAESVFCVGSSGAVSSKIKPLDVVVSTATVEHDFNLKFVKRDKPKFKSDERLISKFKNIKAESFTLHFGLVASGDEDVLDTVRADEIHRETGALVTAWEGAGGARVCKFLSVPFVEVRTVSDSADENAAQDFKQFLSKSMANLAYLFCKLD